MPIPGKKCLPLPASPYTVDHLHRHKIHSSTSPLSRGVPKTRNIPPAAAHKPACSHKSVRCPWLRAWNAFNEGSSSSKTTQCETLRLIPFSGPGGRRFKSSLPDHCFQAYKAHFWCCIYSAVVDFVGHKSTQVPEIERRM